MKQILLSLTFILFFIAIVLTGCKKNPAPTDVNTMVSQGKQIIYFKILTPTAITGVIDTIARTITAAVPSGTNLTSLSTDISLASEYTISPASGVA